MKFEQVFSAFGNHYPFLAVKFCDAKLFLATTPLIYGNIDSMYSLNDFPTLSSLDEAFRIDSPSCISFKENDLKFDFFFYPKKKKKLLIFFPSALPKNKRIVPSFHRWSWCEKFKEYDCLCVSDPTLHLSPEMLGGWMQGTKENWALENLVKKLENLCVDHLYETIIFTGSSLGGFCAIQASFIFSVNGVSNFYYAENPQITLYKYIYKSHIDKIATVSFGEKSIDHLNDYSYRFDVVKTATKYGYHFNGLVVIKESDDHHFNVHIGYLKENLPCINVEIISKEVDSTGHTPLDFDQMNIRIKYIEEKFK